MRPAAPFVVGVPRSGTTLLRLMLDAHRELAIPAETHFLPRLIDRWQELEAAAAPDRERRRELMRVIVEHPRWGDFGLPTEALERQLARPRELSLADAMRALHLAHAEAQGKPRWGDKTPQYVIKMARIQAHLPEATFVHVIRDGRDVAISWGEVSWGVAEVAEAARRWRRQITLARRRSRKLRPATYLEVRYEDLVSEPEATLRRIAAAIELAWDPSMLAYHRDAGERMAPALRELRSASGRTIGEAERRRQHALVVEPPRRDRIGRWRREMAAADVAAFERVAGDLLEALGYELVSRSGPRAHGSRRAAREGPRGGSSAVRSRARAGPW